MQGKAESVRTLLSLGVAPDPRNKQGLSPLVMAAACGCGSAVADLVQAGADAGLVLSGGSTVLHMSADMGLTEVSSSERNDVSVSFLRPVSTVPRGKCTDFWPRSRAWYLFQGCRGTYRDRGRSQVCGSTGLKGSSAGPPGGNVGTTTSRGAPPAPRRSRSRCDARGCHGTRKGERAPNEEPPREVVRQRCAACSAVCLSVRGIPSMS